MFSLRKSTAAYRLKLYDFLVRHGYEVHRVEGPDQFLGDRITPANLMRWDVYDVFCVPSS
jgi:hypothetical protein